MDSILSPRLRHLESSACASLARVPAALPRSSGGCNALPRRRSSAGGGIRPQRTWRHHGDGGRAATRSCRRRGGRSQRCRRPRAQPHARAARWTTCAPPRCPLPDGVVSLRLRVRRGDSEAQVAARAAAAGGHLCPIIGRAPPLQAGIMDFAASARRSSTTTRTSRCGWRSCPRTTASRTYRQARQRHAWGSTAAWREWRASCARDSGR